MQFLKTLFWCLLAFVAALFTLANWTMVPIRLWGGLTADVNLPLLLLVTFLLGLVPLWAYHRAVRWRLRTRLGAAERAVADIRAATTPAPTMPLPDALPPHGGFTLTPAHGGSTLTAPYDGFTPTPMGEALPVEPAP
jgi:putative membrane protein